MLISRARKAITSASVEAVRDEPMLFGATLDFAKREGGHLTRVLCAWLEDLDPHSNVIVDTRTHMLMKGWYPAIPGWHCDAIPRKEDGQPDFNDPRIAGIRHFMCVIDCGTEALTEFVTFKDVPIWPETPEGENVWAVRSRMINNMPPDKLDVVTVESNVLYEFGPHDYHRAMPAKRNGGWRFFFRASVDTTNLPKNVIRKQTQVYLPDVDMGW